MADTPRTERREFFRVKDRLYLEVREVDSKECETLRESLQRSGLLAESLDQASSRRTGTPSPKDEIFEYLELVDRKLDMVLDQLAGRESLFQGKYVDVVMSGSGLRYVSDSKLEKGTFVELRIGLPICRGQRICALGKVTACTKRQAKSEAEWETAIGFVAINEKDRDVLVSYVFSKERESLRARHEEP
jgi:hypothetical protein